MRQIVLFISKVIIAALILGMFSTVVQARSTTLVEPQQVTIPCELSEKQMRMGIRNGGAVRNWVVVKQEPGVTELNYVKGANKHSLNINVHYTKDTFSVKYKDSFNLNYHVKKGVKKLHPNAVKWMSNVSADIQRFATSQCFEE